MKNSKKCLKMMFDAENNSLTRKGEKCFLLNLLNVWVSHVKNCKQKVNLEIMSGGGSFLVADW